MVKRGLLLALVLLLVLPAAQVMAASVPTKVQGESMMHFVVDGVEYAPPADQVGGFFYLNKGTHTYVPLRFVGNILKKSVKYDGKARVVTVSDPTAEELASIEQIRASYVVENSVIEPKDSSTLTMTELPIQKSDVSYVFNGKKVAPGELTPGLLVDGGRIYVPLRFMVESLGYEVGWDKATYTISVEIDYKDLVDAAEREINRLKKELLGEIIEITSSRGLTLLQVMGGDITNEDRKALLEAGEPLLDEYKGLALQVLDELTANLTAKGFSTEVVDEHLQSFESSEKQARDIIGKVE